ncbi:MAG: response regulator transcription factor [Flavobacteriales bacterium]|nr:response regulator transcription factor [Flavobacteriales bacterium]
MKPVERPAEDPLPVAVVDDATLVRLGCRACLAAEGRYAVVLECADGHELLDALAAGAAPRVVLVDLGLPGPEGRSLLEHLATAHPGLPVVALAAHYTDEAILQAYRQGARALVDKALRHAELPPVLDAVLRGAVWHTPQSQRVLLDNPDGLTAEERQRQRLLAQLTPREREVLLAMCRGDDPTYEAVAQELGVCRRTVETYAGRLFTVFGVRSKPALLLSAVRLRMVRV